MSIEAMKQALEALEAVLTYEQPYIDKSKAAQKILRAAIAEAKNSAYKERNQLVALLSTLFPSGKGRTAIEGWDDTWHGCVYIDFPWGQASWHYHDNEAWMFEHLPSYQKQWDGHTTEQKYAAIERYVAGVRVKENT